MADVVARDDALGSLLILHLALAKFGVGLKLLAWDVIAPPCHESAHLLGTPKIDKILNMT